MLQFTDEWLEKVQSSTDIVALIGKRVALKQSGKNYVGLCPFHEEKTPSFSVNPEKQFFYCFGCGTGGNAFNFLMKMDNLSFPEAAVRLAELAGIPIPSTSPRYEQEIRQKRELYHINHLAAQYYYGTLVSPRGFKAREYLIKRNISGQLVRQFFLGFATSEWHGLINFLKSKGVEIEKALEAGLIIEGQKGPYDRFRNRIIFPILDHQGRFLAFGGRVFDQSHPKYINSPETPIYQKANNLYGLNLAKENIIKEDSVVIVEGYTDCIALFAKGIQNVVASLGTAFTENQARLLARFTNNVIIAFDGDVAGEQAIGRGLEILKGQGLNVKVAVLSPGDDPDTFAKRSTKGEVQEWLRNAKPYTQYLIEKAVFANDIDSLEGKLLASKEVVRIIVSLDNAIERQEYISFASDLLAIDKQSLSIEVAKLEEIDNKRNFPHILSQNRHTKEDRDVVESGENLLERRILQWILAKPALLDELLNIGISWEDFENHKYQHLLRLLIRGTWDQQGELIAEELYHDNQPLSDWENYLDNFQLRLYAKELLKIEEKLISLEKDIEILPTKREIFQVIYEYYGIRKRIFLLNERNINEGPLERGGIDER